MPSYLTLSRMPAEGADLVRAINDDSFRRRCEAAYPPDWGCWGGPPEHITAFNEGEHAPDAAVLERAARLSPVTKIDMQSLRDSELAAFEAWAERECPSGDADSVQYQWASSSDYAEWLEANPEAA